MHLIADLALLRVAVARQVLLHLDLAARLRLRGAVLRKYVPLLLIATRGHICY